MLSTLENFAQTYNYHLVVEQGAKVSSVALLGKARFSATPTRLDMHDLAAQFGVVLDGGDLLAVRAAEATGSEFLIGVFHGNKEGTSSPKVVDMMRNLQCVGGCGSSVLVLGMDANTFYDPPSPKNQDVVEFYYKCLSVGLTSVFQDNLLLSNLGDPSSFYGSLEDFEVDTISSLGSSATTRKARTLAQAQSASAVFRENLVEKADRNPKDHIVFDAQQIKVLQVLRHNHKNPELPYDRKAFFPTFNFPSDHALVEVRTRV